MDDDGDVGIKNTSQGKFRSSSRKRGETVL